MMQVMGWLLLIMAVATTSQPAHADAVTVGAERVDVWRELLAGKRVGLLSNHTGIDRSGRHTVDALLDAGIEVTRIFSPEHGFRGTADAGEHVKSGVDGRTGISVVSLFGGKRYPTEEEVADVDVVVCDMQDVGLRFYTYYCTMLDVMDAAANAGKEFVVLDRPNPNGMTVDGPVLDMKYASGVGRLPIPVMHGMTLGELARMIVGEGWLKGHRSLRLEVVECEGYDHNTRYRLPTAPSPNLKSMLAVYLYGSMCYFEATDMSLGRGTEMPFCVWGAPSLKGKPGCGFSFTPRSMSGAKNPPQRNRECWGHDLRGMNEEEAIAGGLDLSYIVEACRVSGRGAGLLTPFFEKLIGTGRVRRMIASGATAEEIRATWVADVDAFKARRKKYLLYNE